MFLGPFQRNQKEPLLFSGFPPSMRPNHVEVSVLRSKAGLRSISSISPFGRNMV